MTTVKNVFNSTERFPVLGPYVGQYFQQNAFISLDLRNGEINADYNKNIGGRVPFPVFKGYVLWFKITPYLLNESINNLIERSIDYFQEIFNEIEANDFKDEEEKYYTLEKISSELYCESCDLAVNVINNREDLYDYLNDAIYPNKGQSFAEFAKAIIDNMLYTGDYLSDNLNNIDSLISCLADLWANELYNGNVLPKKVAQYLLESGVCDNSSWLEELKEFAA
jgi:hypothetical protein